MKILGLQLVIVSPEHTLFEGKVESITLPGTLGEFVVWPEHAPIISSLQKGVIRYKHEGQEDKLEIQHGFVEVRDNNVSVCAEQ